MKGRGRIKKMIILGRRERKMLLLLPLLVMLHKRRESIELESRMDALKNSRLIRKCLWS